MATCVCGREIQNPVTGRPRKRCDRCSPRRDQSSRKAPVLTLADRKPVQSSDKALADLTRSTLAEAGRLNTWHGAAALTAAKLIDAGSYTAQGAAALLKAHREAMDIAMAGAGASADVIDLIFSDQA